MEEGPPQAGLKATFQLPSSVKMSDNVLGSSRGRLHAADWELDFRVSANMTGIGDEEYGGAADLAMDTAELGLRRVRLGRLVVDDAEENLFPWDWPMHRPRCALGCERERPAVL